nr:PepSY domain-containing protein [Streptomyces sp. 2112.3]
MGHLAPHRRNSHVRLSDSLERHGRGLTRYGIDLHTGTLFGIVNQLALAALALALIFLILWGYRMWWAGRCHCSACRSPRSWACSHADGLPFRPLLGTDRLRGPCGRATSSASGRRPRVPSRRGATESRR